MKGKIEKRVAMYIVGLFLYSLGIAISAKAALGIAPISTLPYAMSHILPISFGATTFIMTIIYILIQIIIYGKDFEKRQYLQIAVGILFSVFIDASMRLIAFVSPVSYTEKLLVLIIGCVVLSFGIVLSVIPNVITPPAEGAIAAIAHKLNKEFGNVKIVFDSTIVLLSIIVSMVFIGHLVGFKEGTVISVIITGLLTKYLLKYFGQRLETLVK